MTPAIEVVNLSRRFGAFLAVDGVSFQVERGEIFGYLGANGAGKSTTIRMLTGLLRPTSGTARVAGCDINGSPASLKSRIGYMSQKFSLYLDLPVLENLYFFGGAYGLSGRTLRTRAARALEAMGLSEHAGSTTGALPGGTRQRLALACALLHEPEIVFLDEPTAGVDPQARRIFWRVIKGLASAGTTVFVTTHYLDEAEYCARIGLMVDGKLVALDSPQALKQKYVPERIAIARGTNLAATESGLRAQRGIHSVAPFGAALHIRVADHALSNDDLERLMAHAGASNVRIEPGEATMEDVFLEVVGATTVAHGEGNAGAGSQTDDGATP